MAEQIAVVLHRGAVIQRKHSTITRTACGRSRTVSDGMNIAANDSAVTCKFCLRLIAKEARHG